MIWQRLDVSLAFCISNFPVQWNTEFHPHRGDIASLSRKPLPLPFFRNFRHDANALSWWPWVVGRANIFWPLKYVGRMRSLRECRPYSTTSKGRAPFDYMSAWLYSNFGHIERRKDVRCEWYHAITTDINIRDTPLFLGELEYL